MAKRHKVSRKHVEKGQGTFDTGSRTFLKLQEGKNVIRILPPWSEEGRIYRQVGFHSPPKKFAEKVICTNFTFEGKDGYPDCPICAKGLSLHKKYGKDASRHYWAQKRAFMNVLDMKKKDGVVYVMEAGGTIMTPILNYMSELEDDGEDDLVDEKHGQNILIKRFQEAGFTKYSVMVMPKPYDLEKNGYDVDDIFDSLHNLDDLCKAPDPEEVQDLLAELNEYTDGGDDEEEDADTMGGSDDDDDSDGMADDDSDLDDDVSGGEDDDDEEEAEEKKSKPEKGKGRKGKGKGKAKAKGAKKAAKKKKPEPVDDALGDDDDLGVDDVSDIGDDDLGSLDDEDEIPF